MAEWSPPIISGNWWHRGAEACSLTPVLWKSDGLPLTQLWLILSDYINLYRSLVGSLKRAHWFLIRMPLNTSRKELGKYNLQLQRFRTISILGSSLRQCEAWMVLYRLTTLEVTQNHWDWKKHLEFSQKWWNYEVAIWSKHPVRLREQR